MDGQSDDTSWGVAEVLAELGYWLELNRQAARLSDEGPVTMTQHAERSAGEHEMTTIMFVLAGCSTPLRQRFEATIIHSIRLLREAAATQPDVGYRASPHLRTVPQ